MKISGLQNADFCSSPASEEQLDFLYQPQYMARKVSPAPTGSSRTPERDVTVKALRGMLLVIQQPHFARNSEEFQCPQASGSPESPVSDPFA